MAVFISYSHADKDFVDRFAMKLVENRTHVWLDRWELRVGDSLIQKIQDAIQESDALVVVLSKTSVESEWCKKELDAGLLRELEEKRVVVLPVIIDDCKLPLFVRGKYWADFKGKFDEAMASVLTALARVTSDVLGRTTQGETDADWSIDAWDDEENSCYHMTLTIAERTSSMPYTVLSEVHVTGNEVAARRMRLYISEGLDWFGRQVWLELTTSVLFKSKNDRLRLEDNRPVKLELGCKDSRIGAVLHVDIAVRRLGEDSGRDTIIDLGSQLTMTLKTLQRTTGQPSEEEMKAMGRVLRTAWGG